MLDVAEHVEVVTSEGHVGGDDGEGDVAKRADAQGVGRAEGEQHVGGRRDRHPFGLEEIAQGQLEGAAAGVDPHGLRARLGLDRVEALGDERVGLVPGDGLEGVLALGPVPLERGTQAMLGVDNLRRVLAAPAHSTQRMVRVRPHLHQSSLFDPRLNPAAGGTDAADGFLPAHITLNSAGPITG